jgi:predicted nucleic-acid-binding protein
MEGQGMPKLQQIAVDTNILLNLAKRDETVIDCIQTLKKRLPNSQIIVLPTVILELIHIADSPEQDTPAHPLAKVVLSSILDPWKFIPINCLPVGHGIIEQIGKKIRDKGLLPDEEYNDSLIIGEAAYMKAEILVSSDAHIKNIDQQILRIELNACDVGCPVIASPWKIVNQFFR